MQVTQEKVSQKGILEKVFKLSEHGTNVKTEVIAGLTTFMTMAYILAVNSNMLADAGMDADTRRGHRPCFPLSAYILHRHDLQYGI